MIPCLLQALTIAYPERKEAKKEEVPLWIIIVAAIGGVLLLGLLILVLWLVSKRELLVTQLWQSVVKWLGRSAQDERILGSSPGLTRSLYQRPSGVWIHTPRRPFGIIRKE
jgi:flagellar basal body-associated protein FliL